MHYALCIMHYALCQDKIVLKNPDCFVFENSLNPDCFVFENSLNDSKA